MTTGSLQMYVQQEAFGDCIQMVDFEWMFAPIAT